MNWYKTAEQNRPIISFDFDDTIFSLKWNEEEHDFDRDENGDPIGTLNENTKSLMNHYANTGAKVIIVSSRMNSTKQEIEDFVGKHNLPVSEIHCTNGDPKLMILKSIGALKHYDDDPSEIGLINSDGSLAGVLV